MTSATTDRRLGLVGGTAVKAPVACATTANITLSGEQTIDGVTTSTSRVLVKNQTNGVQNGIYLSSSAAWTRDIDCNGNLDVVTGTLVGVTGGTTQARSFWQITTTGTITIDTTSIAWAICLTAAAISSYMTTVLAATTDTAARALLLAVGWTDLQNQTYTSFTTTNTSTAFVLTPTPAVTALATGQEFDVTFHVAAGATPTLAISGLTAKNLKYLDNTGAKQAINSVMVPSGWRSRVVYDGTDYIVRTTAISGKIAQQVTTQTGAVATGTTVIPQDDTIPQNTEGDQYMSLAITPINANSTLEISCLLNASNSIGNSIIAALFQDSTANALAVVDVNQSSATGMIILNLTHVMTAGTTSATTFKVRIGSAGASTTTFNGQSGGRLFGGVFASRITIKEYLP